MCIRDSLHAEREIGITDRVDEDCQYQNHGGPRNYRSRPLRFLGCLRDRFQADEGDDRQRRSLHQSKHRRPRDVHRMNEDLRLKGEEESETEDERFA